MAYGSAPGHGKCVPKARARLERTLSRISFRLSIACSGREAIEALLEKQERNSAIKTSELGLEVFINGAWREWHDDGNLDVTERFCSSTLKERSMIAV